MGYEEDIRVLREKIDDIEDFNAEEFIDGIF